MADWFQIARENIELISAIVGLLLALSSVYGFLKSNRPRIKKMRYILFNQLIQVNLDAAKDYPPFIPDMQNVRANITEAFRNKGKKVRFEAVGKNYLIVLVEGLLGPFKIEFQPKMNDGDEVDAEDVGETQTEIGTEVRIKYVGTLKFYYRKDKMNMDYLISIDTLFEAIEDKYDLRAGYKNYHLVSTPSSDFAEDWSRCITSEENETKVSIGSKVVDVNSTSINPLYEAYKKNIVAV